MKSHWFRVKPALRVWYNRQLSNGHCIGSGETLFQMNLVCRLCGGVRRACDIVTVLSFSPVLFHQHCVRMGCVCVRAYAFNIDYPRSNSQ